MKVTISGTLSIWILLYGQVLGQSSPTPNPSPTPVSEDELKRSTDKFNKELEKTKEEVGAALTDPKKEEPKPTPKPKQTVRRRVRRTERSQTVRIKSDPTIVSISSDNTNVTVTPRPTIPLTKVETPKENRVKVTLSTPKKERTFWETVWHYLPFRFFGEH